MSADKSVLIVLGFTKHNINLSNCIDDCRIGISVILGVLLNTSEQQNNTNYNFC